MRPKIGVALNLHIKVVNCVVKCQLACTQRSWQLRRCTSEASGLRSVVVRRGIIPPTGSGSLVVAIPIASPPGMAPSCLAPIRRDVVTGLLFFWLAAAALTNHRSTRCISRMGAGTMERPPRKRDLAEIPPAIWWDSAIVSKTRRLGLLNQT